jgi:hypothetical protein
LLGIRWHQDLDRTLGLKLHAQTCTLIANAHQTCQCDQNPWVMKKVFVQPASTPNRHAASAPAVAATGVNKSPGATMPA